MLVQARLQKVCGLSRNQQVDVGGTNCSNHCIFDQLATDRQLSHPRCLDLRLRTISILEVWLAPLIHFLFMAIGTDFAELTIPDCGESPSYSEDQTCSKCII